MKVETLGSEILSKTRHFAEAFATLLLFWVLLNGTVRADVVAVGVLVAFVIAALFRDGLSFLFEFRFTPRSLWASGLFFVYFLKELVIANVRLAVIVSTPALPIRPGIVKVRTRLKSRVGRLLLANAITLTPGTLTVALDGEWLFIHWVTVEADDIDAATQSIVAGFEKYLQVMYG
ncbi:Na+/H+ antiporter subunit E [Varunaivibrio sulfuroxidans]|uniref:Multicomponent Na+:H+ antiporter subunit E n=1 Tax=Varunaivibrio sulfuroxidans TaxID=1773489 RepID=A0A4R3JIR3_9PROT|nr:Na+/H+ antiporter subunit E [Varunaivibrio sulfuroxidans]TCS64700.1 multicomponent Na+:H+ antiporter subunit E [Varunaivibrio sulfuroxidans]WES29993.1 Na+/H+ antiporter subunit E [Varunaivibrio sulfuroxidans]